MAAMVMVDLTAAEALDLSDWQRELIACEVSICEESLREYIKMAWPILEPATPFIPNWHIDCICDHLAAVSAGQIKRLVINVPPGSSKALDSDTPVLTTWGWKRHGDLFRGDFVYGPDGTPKRVLGCTEERLEDSYAVKFDDGAEIIAGAEHLWAVERDEMVRLPKFKRSRVSRVVDTPDLRVSGYKRRKDEQRPDRIAICDPVQWPSRRFLIDPYVLGAWLGDGATISGALYSAEEDIRHFETLGEIRYVSPAGGTRTQNFYRINIPGLQTKLRVLGLLGNKHIPDDYLESSVEQRWALLQGLMDTDGHCSKSGVCQFTTRLPQLATQVHQLASSLGLKVHSRSRYTFLNGKRYGPHHHLSFVPRKGDLVFRLARKQLKINGNLNPRSRYRYVSSVTPVGKRVVKCIQVEGSIYLAGRAFVPTHNSLLTCALWPTWHWTQWPADRFMTASYTDVLSIRDALKSRRLIQSRWYQERWGHMFQLTGDQAAKMRYENNKTGYRIATHVGGATGERAKIRILDDPHNIEDVESDTIRESTINWVRTTWAEREADAKTGGDVIVMQRLHQRDVSGVLLDEIGGYEHVMIPMRYEPTRRFMTVATNPLSGKPWTDPRTAEGQLLCPERWDEEDVRLKEKRLGIYSASGQLQQRPSPESGGILKRHWFQYWQHPGDNLPPVVVKWPDGTHREVKPVDLPYVFDRTVQSWDMTFKGTVGTDYVVGQQFGLKGPDAFLIDQSRGRRDFPGTLAEVREFTAKHKRYQGKILIEDKANGPAIIATLRREIPGIVPHHGNDDKIARAHAHAYIVEGGNFFLPHPQIAPWVEDFLEECTAYPNGAHDDQCFPAGTMIATLRGDRPIESILPGEFVLTPFGMRRVLHAGQTGSAELFSYRGVRATAGHKVFTRNAGFVRLDGLTNGMDIDHLAIRSLIRWTYQRGLCLTESPTRLWGRESIISASRKPWKGESVRRACMSQFGKIITDGQFLRAMMFITRMTTRTIMTLSIWSVYRVHNIAACIRTKIQKSSSCIWRALDRLRPHGKGARKGESITANRARSSGNLELGNLISVSIAESLSKLGRSAWSNIVLLSAGITEGLTKPVRCAQPSMEFASSVGVRSLRLSQSGNHGFVQHVAAPVTPSLSTKIVPVYNLEVEHDHVYYANGVLVSNCDSWSQAMSDLYAIEDKGHPITPQYSAKFHQSSKGLEPVPGWPCFRFWYQGVHPCCIVGQIHRDATIILIDCVLGEQSSTVEQLIDRKVIPLLASDYRGCTEWRDVTNHGLLNAKSDQTEHHLDQIISAKLDGSAEPGEPDFFVRLNAIVGLLAQTGRLVVNSAPTPGETKPWIHEALNGGYAYRKDASGVISKSEPRKFHPLTSVGEALGHGLARVFQRKPLPPRKFDRHEAQKRAKQYAI